jgi:hypothetical protein
MKIVALKEKGKKNFFLLIPITEEDIMELQKNIQLHKIFEKGDKKWKRIISF